MRIRDSQSGLRPSAEAADRLFEMFGAVSWAWYFEYGQITNYSALSEFVRDGTGEDGRPDHPLLSTFFGGQACCGGSILGVVGLTHQRLRAVAKKQTPPSFHI
ncbi:hypothetical protein D3C86_1804080 [compost metagenome]